MLVALGLAACGGSDGEPTTQGPPTTFGSFDTASTSTGVVAFAGYTGLGSTVQAVNAGQIDLETGAISSGVFEGTINAARTEIALAGGGTVTLEAPAGFDYARFYAVSGSTAFSGAGVTGFPIPASDVPASGSTTYGGPSRVVAVNDLGVYEVAGDARISVDLDSRRVDIDLSGLDGTLTSAATGVTAVTGATVGVTDSAISGSGFAGGSAPASRTTLVPLSGAADASGTVGYFLGPNGDEVAGRVTIDDTSGSGALIQGLFLGD